MGMTDPIADMLTRIRNGAKAGKKWIDVPASKLKIELSRILAEEKYIASYRYTEDSKQGILRLSLRYDEKEKSVIKGIKRVSTPGLRRYSRSDKLPRVINGLGVAIISTSTGVMTDRDARKRGVGGEVICYIW